MSGEHYTYTPFDEQAAQERLERLRLAVEQSRKRRKDASDAFDAFVGSFRKDGRNESTPLAPSPPPVVEAIRPVVATYDEPMPYPAPAATSRRPLPRTGVILGAVAVVATSIMLTRAWRGSPDDRSAATSTQAPTQSGAIPGASAPTETQPIPGMLQGELAAVRRVWIRATVDGARVVERELQANERVTLRPARTIVVRAGDAGAVRVVIDGRDQGLLGANGIAVTRTYTAAAPVTR
jgi:uncharacterized protein DUF4115